MAEVAIKPDLYLLQRLPLLASLPVASLHKLSQQARIETIPGGEVIFTEGDLDTRTLYLLDGKVEIILDGNNRHTLTHKSALAGQPLCLYTPRPVTVVAKERCSLLVFEQDMLNKAMTAHSDSGFELEELAIEGDQHTFSHLLNSPDLLQLPPEDIEVVLGNVERISVECGHVMIWQGDNDPWYYTLLQGRARVTRIPESTSQEITLAELGPGSRFGEEALITGRPRNATVTMISDGSLLRLHGDIFRRHVVEAFVNQLDYNEVINRLKQGAVFIDVRNEDEYRENGHGINIPLPLIRLKLNRLDKEIEYIMACNDGRLSLAAAFLARRHGLKVSILRDGLANLERMRA